MHHLLALQQNENETRKVSTANLLIDDGSEYSAHEAPSVNQIQQSFKNYKKLQKELFKGSQVALFDQSLLMSEQEQQLLHSISLKKSLRKDPAIKRNVTFKDGIKSKSNFNLLRNKDRGAPGMGAKLGSLRNQSYMDFEKMYSKNNFN